MEINTIVTPSEYDFGEDGVLKTPIEGLLLLSRKWFGDNRGAFQELFRTRIVSTYLGRELPPILQSQISWSSKNVIRGMHAGPEYKLIFPMIGDFTIAVVDVREKSHTFGKWIGLRINNIPGERSFGYLVSPGIANGSEVRNVPEEIGKALYMYQVTEEYSPKTSIGFNVFDQEINFPWSIQNPEVSDNDKKQQSYKEFIQTVDQSMYK